MENNMLEEQNKTEQNKIKKDKTKQNLIRIKKIKEEQTIITNNKKEWAIWIKFKDFIVYINKKNKSIFKRKGEVYNITAIKWRKNGRLYIGRIRNFSSIQNINELPFNAKSFIIDINKDNKIIDRKKLSEAVKYYKKGDKI